MITFLCSRCKGTCQVGPSRAGRLHTCEYCGLILTVPGKPAPRPRPKQPTQVRRLGMVELLIGAGAVVSLGAVGLTILALGNGPGHGPRRVHVEVSEEAAVVPTVSSARPVQRGQQPAPAPVQTSAKSAPTRAPAELEPVVVIVE